MKSESKFFFASNLLISATISSKTPLLRPPLILRKNGLYNGVVLLLS